MTPEQKRKFNTSFGTVFMTFGVLAWGLAAYYAFTPNPPKPAPAIMAPSVDLNSCRNALSSLGFMVSVSGDDITAFQAIGENPREQLERTSVAALICKLPVKEFCMGEGCEKPGISITLDGRKDSGTPAPAKP